jgi:hypothetical protein
MIYNRRCNNLGHGINVIRDALVCVRAYVYVHSATLTESKVENKLF